MNNIILPKVGDWIEFLSDAQTKSGPYAGVVISVDRMHNTVSVRYSNGVESFDWQAIKIRNYTVADDGQPLWSLR